MSTKNSFLSKYSKKQPNIGDKNIFEKTKYEILRHNYLVLDALATSLGYTIALEKGYIFRGYFEQVELSPFGDLIIDTGNLENLVEIAQNNLDKTDDESIKFMAVEDSIFLPKISYWRSDVLSKLREVVSENDDIMRVRIADIDEKFREATLKLVSDYPSSFKDLCYIHHSENDLRATIAMIIKTIGYIHIYKFLDIVHNDLMRCFLSVALLCRDDKDSYINTQDWYSLFNDILMSIIDIVNQNLGTEIHIDDFTLIDENDEEALYEIWQEVVNKSENVLYMGSGEFEYSVSLEDESEENIDEELELYQEPQPDSKASAAILKFFDSNSNALIAKLKDSGLQLSASALQNDQNITRVANVVYNLLPGMVRIFVSFDTVENFLFEHRQWLINKLV